jgi:hypothetical protein
MGLILQGQQHEDEQTLSKHQHDCTTRESTASKQTEDSRHNLVQRSQLRHALRAAMQATKLLLCSARQAACAAVPAPLITWQVVPPPSAVP